MWIKSHVTRPKIIFYSRNVVDFKVTDEWNVDFQETLKDLMFSKKPILEFWSDTLRIERSQLD
jgi:hypothetical protein